jgi:coenzyme PQQ precursor peptide PqqA
LTGFGHAFRFDMLSGVGAITDEGTAMNTKWKRPVIIEIAVGCEINAYACAEVL